MSKQKTTETVRCAFSSPPAGVAPTLLSAAGAEPESLVWLAVLPPSPFTTQAHDARHGVTFEYDEAALVAELLGRKRKPGLTIEHNDIARHERDTRSRGWAEAYGRFEAGELAAGFRLNDLGRHEHEQRYYGGTSAATQGFWLDEAHTRFRITRLQSVTLTNDPSCEMTMNFTADTAPAPSATQENNSSEEPPMLKAILAAIGVADDADEATVLSAIEALKTPTPNEAEAALTAVGFSVADLGSLVRVDELNAAKAEVVALTAEVSTLKAAAEDAQLSILVDGYVRDRRITPAQRDQALALARASMEAFSAFIESTPALIDDQPTRAPVTDGLQLTAEARAKAKALGISPEAYATALEQTRSALGI